MVEQGTHKPLPLNAVVLLVQGRLVRTLDTGVGGFTTGMDTDSCGRLYVVAYTANEVHRFDPEGLWLGRFGDIAGTCGTPEPDR